MVGGSRYGGVMGDSKSSKSSDSNASDEMPERGGPTVPKGSEPSLQWAYEPVDDDSWGADSDLAAEVARYKAEQLPEVEAEAAPPGPPPKKSEHKAGPSDLPPPRSMRRPPLKRRHSVKLPFRRFPPQTVSDLMTRKLIAVGEGESLQAIEDGMREYRMRHFPVVNQKNELIGLVSWDDLMLASSSSLSAERERRDKLIHHAGHAVDIMKRDVLSVRPDESIGDVGNVMMLKHVRCIPVTDDRNILVGLLTEDNFMQLALDFIEAM
jgi:CBS domain-containing protein